MRFDLNELGFQYDRSWLDRLRSIKKPNKYYNLYRKDTKSFFRTMFEGMKDIRLKYPVVDYISNYHIMNYPPFPHIILSYRDINVTRDRIIVKY